MSKEGLVARYSFIRHGVKLETEAHGDGIVIRCGLEDPLEEREGEFGFGVAMQPTEAVEFALGIIHESWKIVRLRLGPLLKLGFDMGWLEEKGLYKDG